MSKIPKVKIAILGGSTTIGADFPRAYKELEIINENIVFETPFGSTAPFTHAEVDGKISFMWIFTVSIRRSETLSLIAAESVSSMYFGRRE
jgi:hypothetical protein